MEDDSGWISDAEYADKMEWCRKKKEEMLLQEQEMLLEQKALEEEMLLKQKAFEEESLLLQKEVEFLQNYRESQKKLMEEGIARATYLRNLAESVPPELRSVEFDMYLIESYIDIIMSAIKPLTTFGQEPVDSNALEEQFRAL
jgi:hypothetical protein